MYKLQRSVRYVDSAKSSSSVPREILEFDIVWPQTDAAIVRMVV